MVQIHTLVVGPLETNCYIVSHSQSDRCLVIDPGYEPEKIRKETERLGKTISAILLTHGHFDHTGGVRELFGETDCDIYLCPEDRVMPENMTAGPLCYTCGCREGDILNLEGLQIRVLHTPGHTPGSVCFLVEDALFSGDTLFSGSCGRTDLPCSDWAQLMRSLSRLKALEGDYTVYPGHGEKTTLSAERRYNPYMR